MALTYPHTRTIDHVDDYHGTLVADPYRWLEDDRSPETMAWVKEQNAVTMPYLRSLPMRQSFHDRIADLFNHMRYGLVVKEGGKWFFTRNDGLQNQATLFVADSADSEPRELIDPNVFSTDGTTSMVSWSVSPGGTYVAYSVSEGGSDWVEIRVRNVETGVDLQDVVRWVKFSGASWTQDEGGFYYSRFPETDDADLLKGKNENHTVYYHRLGEDQTNDVIIHKQTDNPEWLFGARVHEGGKWLVVSIRGMDPENMLFAADLGDPASPNVAPRLQPIVNRFDSVNTSVGVVDNTLFIVTTRDAPKGRVVAVDLASPVEADWKTIVPESDLPISQVILAGGRLVVGRTMDACSQLFMYALDGSPIGEIPLQTLGTAIALDWSFSDEEFIYGFTSFVTPFRAYRHNLATGESVPFGVAHADVHSDSYVVKKEWATSRDGTEVPLFIVHHKNVVLDGTNRTILYGYGGFNVPMSPTFSSVSLAWMEQGGIYVQALLRGGGEYGEEWYKAGTLDRKQNVFDDFISVAEHLFTRKYTSPAHLTIRGGSNGGLLVGAVMVQRPDLAACVIPEVGVMDMLRYQHFTIGRHWARDYGLSDDPEMFPLLYSYSPLHNLRDDVDYPAVLVMTGDHDDRVVPAHSFKFAARLQAVPRNGRPALIRIETNAGHGTGKSTSAVIQESADLLAFAYHHT